jgi:sugar transferase (PEP-CTERM/EpsH1 system associated)
MHLTYALDVGGLETLLVDCINKMPADQYRHVVVCLTRSSSFAERITQPGVEVHALNKAPGLGLGTHVAFWKLARRLRPTILHTYNLAAMEYAFAATLARVPVRVHAEHGRDTSDPHGLNPKHNFLRRRLAPFIDCYVPVSEDLNLWLGKVVKIAPAKTLFIKNGVDTDKYRPGVRGAGAPWGPEHFVIGTVARVSDIKNHRGLVDAFIRLRALLPGHAASLRLSIIGDGPLLPALRAQANEGLAAGCTQRCGAAGAGIFRVRAALAGRRHARVAAGSHGVRAAGGGVERGRHSRSGHGTGGRQPGAAAGCGSPGPGAGAVRRIPCAGK